MSTAHTTELFKKTYARESDTTITALGGCSRLLDVVVDEPAAWRLDDASAVGGGVVRIALAQCHTLGHR